jgi:hypothetical protein
MKKLLFLALSCSLWACKDDEVTPDVQPPQEKPTATVTVWNTKQWSTENPKGVPAEGATVELYTSRQDFLSKKPAYTATTNKDGVAKFDIPEGEYFMVARKGSLTNTWSDAQGMTRVSDTLFQTEAEIFDLTQPIQQYVLPGDFKCADLNGDGIINNNDVAEAPFFKLTVKKDSVNATRALIGSTINHAYASYNEIEEKLHLTEFPKIAAAHRQMVMLDGILSDEADCQIQNLPSGWCDLDKFTFTPTNSIVENIWKSHYASILELNKMLSSLNGIQGEKADLIAQLRAFRAYLYLELHTYFGALPITEQLLMYPSVSRSSVDQTRKFIKDELTAAMPALTEDRPVTRPWYMTPSAANMLLARIALMDIDATSAVNYTDKVIATTKYALADSAKVFTAPASNEIIWDMTTSLTTGLTSPFKDYFVRGGLKVDFCPAIRYTETYLLNAMGHVMHNEIEDANKSINAVRTRGKKPAINFTTRDEARAEVDALYKEELYREGFRFARLVLYKKALEVLAGKGYQERNAQLPIPMSVLQAYPNFIQNVGY